MFGALPFLVVCSLMILPVSVSPALAQTGRDDDLGLHVATLLQSRYDAIPYNCGSSQTPAYQCSGLLVRGTKAVAPHYPWDPSDQSLRDGGTSLSYLRADATFSRLAKTYDNGIVFYPPYQTPPNLDPLEILCSFPLDGETDSRPGLRGCAQIGQNPYSQVCQSREQPTGPIQTGEDWAAHFRAGHFGSGENGCGFWLHSGAMRPAGITDLSPADAFYASVKARTILQKELHDRPNEVVVATWNRDAGCRLPLEAFFYTHGSQIDDQGGDRQAKQNQANYQRICGRWVPVIAVHLHAAPHDRVTVHYHPSDQN